jgi:hypothetical protein
VRNRELALVALVVYGIAFLAFDLPGWLRLAGAVALGAGWLVLFVGLPILRATRR